jgi:hypothetical protein
MSLLKVPRFSRTTAMEILTRILHADLLELKAQFPQMLRGVTLT